MNHAQALFQKQIARAGSALGQTELEASDTKVALLSHRYQGGVCAGVLKRAEKINTRND